MSKGMSEIISKGIIKAQTKAQNKAQNKEQFMLVILSLCIFFHMDLLDTGNLCF